MDWSLNFADILTVAAIIIRAIAAVQVERARERRNQKFEFLKTLMRTRGDPLLIAHLDPPPGGDVVDPQSTLSKEFLDVPVRQ
jgi:hypothetical protein